MNSNEFKRWLKKKGCRFDVTLGKGGHIVVYYKNNRSVLPMHGKKELGKGLVEDIKKQLGLYPIKMKMRFFNFEIFVYNNMLLA